MTEIEFVNALKVHSEDADELARLLVKFSKISPNILRFESIYAEYIYHKKSEVRQAAIYGLLFRMKIKNKIYKEHVLSLLINEFEDFDLRNWSISSLSVAYFNTQDKELMNAFYSVMMDDNNIYLKQSALSGLLRVFGLSDIDITNRVLQIDTEEFVSLNKKLFSKELSIIEKKIFPN